MQQSRIEVFPANPPRMLTIRQTAACCPLSEYALRLLLKQGKLPAIFVGTKYLVNVDRLIDQLNGEAGA